MATSKAQIVLLIADLSSKSQILPYTVFEIEGKTSRTVTHIGNVCDTPLYWQYCRSFCTTFFSVGKLWTAPEILRDELNFLEGTPKGDVYAFAIILHEIVMRQGPFFLGELAHLEPKGRTK